MPKKTPATELLDRMIGGDVVKVGRKKSFERQKGIADLREIISYARALLNETVSAGTMIATPEALASGKIEQLKKLGTTLARDCRAFSDEIFRIEGRVNALEEIEHDDEFIGFSFEVASEVAEIVERFQSTGPQLAEEIISIVTNKEGA